MPWQGAGLHAPQPLNRDLEAAKASEVGRILVNRNRIAENSSAVVGQALVRPQQELERRRREERAAGNRSESRWMSRFAPARHVRGKEPQLGDSQRERMSAGSWFFTCCNSPPVTWFARSSKTARTAPSRSSSARPG